MILPSTLEFFSSAFKAELSDCDNFEEYVQHFSESFAALVARTVPAANSCFEQNYLTAPCEAFFSNPGKCARPLICMLSNCAFGGNVKESIMAAMAIETFQNAALIHDDIADDATTRRNKPCMHVTEGLGIALNTGDFALSLVDELVLRDSNISDNMKLRVLRELSDMKLKTIAGQAIDIGWARDHKFCLTEQDYFNMATLKTAHYTCASPIAIGAMTAGVSDEILTSLRTFGIKCGLAFQIQDDILNVSRNSEDTSKDFALDIKEGKRTLIAIHAINNLAAKSAKTLTRILDSKETSDNEIKIALQLIEEANSIEYAKNECKALIDEANGIISTCENSSCAFKILRSIPNWCLSRKN